MNKYAIVRADIRWNHNEFRCVLVEILNAIDFIVHIDCERNSIETVIAHTATEAARMIRLPHRLENLQRNKEMFNYVDLNI